MNQKPKEQQHILIKTPYDITQPNHNPYELHNHRISIQRNQINQVYFFESSN